MKTKLIAGLITMLFLTSMLSMRFAAPVAATPDSNIVGLWHFDEGTGSTASDSSGYGNDGTLSGGKFGNALIFDGIDDYVVVADHPSLGGMTELTVEAWIKWGGPTGTAQYIVSKYLETGNQRGFIFGLHSDNTLRMWVSSDGTTASGKFDYLTSSYTPPVGSWTYVAGVFEGGSFIKLFVDGSEIASKTTTVSSIFDNTDVLYIGRYFTDRYHKGSIDEVHISNVARESFDLTQAPLPDANTVALWHFDESVSDVAYDSGNGNDGTILGANWAGPTWTTEGMFDGALEFDGVDDYVGIPDSTSLEPSHVTVEAWINIDSDPGNNKYIVGKHYCSGWNSYALRAFSSGLQFYIGTTSGWIPSPMSGHVWDGNWHYVVGTFDGSYVRLYVDGSEVGTGTPVPADIRIAYDGAGVTIGVPGDPWLGGPYHFGGKIGGVRIWNVALPLAAEIDIDPDTLNLKSNGQWITAYIELPEGYDVNDVDITSIVLATEVGEGFTAEVAPEAPIAIGDHDGDGILDLMVKFDRISLREHLAVAEDLEPSEVAKFYNVPLTVTGKLSDGTPFEGSDTIQVLKK